MTDVVLLGHSMGGLVCAEVALSQLPANNRFRHQLLGTINFDVPFLGMHPSVIKSGLASIFAPAAESPAPQAETASSSYMSAEDASSASLGSGNASTAGHANPPPALPPRRTDTLFHPKRVDPNYNPTFENDVKLPVRKGWRNAWHFVSKHNQDLIIATKQLVKSHMEFGGAMADYSGLKNRYCRIRALEEMDAEVRKSIVGGNDSPPRVRFVNYYTSSTGRPKKPKSQSASPALTPSISRAPTTDILSDEQFVTTPANNSTDQLVQAAQPDQGPQLRLPTEAVQPASESPTLVVEDCDHSDEASTYDLEESNKALNDPMDQLDPLPMSDYGSDTSDAQSWADAVEDVDHGGAMSPAGDGAKITSILGGSTDHGEASTTTTDKLEHAESANDITPSVTSGAPSINDSSLSLATTASLPPIPEPPAKPVEPDFSVYVNKETRKLAEKDHSRALKTYERAMKDRERAIRDREKLEEKRQRMLLKEGKRAEKEEEKEAKSGEKEKAIEAAKKEKAAESVHEKTFELQRRETEREWKETLAMKWNDDDGTVSPMPSSSNSARGAALSTNASLNTVPTLSSFQTTTSQSGDKPEKPHKERTFCMLPPKDSAGNRDPVWIKVFMPNVDEVGAHCGLFFETSPAYEQLVGDVGERITDWVNDGVSEMMAAQLAE